MTFTPGPWEVSNTAYHADRTCDSSSTLEVFRKSMRLYHGIYVTGTIRKRPQTKEQKLGSVLHALLLEPENLHQLVDVPANGELLMDERPQAPKPPKGRIKIDLAAWKRVQRMADAVMSSPEARRLLESSGPCEQSVRWVEPDTGMALKCRYDKMIDDGPLVDLKTAAYPDPESWSKSILNYGYHRQCALYRASRKAVYGCWDEGMLHIVVGSTEPHDVFVYEIDEESVHIGEAQNYETLLALRDCREFHHWEPPHASKITPIGLPTWARRHE